MAEMLTAVERAEPVSVAKILARQADLGSSHWGSLLFGDRLAALGTLGDPTVDDLARSALAELSVGSPAQRLTLAGAEIFIERILPPARLIIVGAVHIAQPLVTFGNELGFHTMVIDARSAFATPERFAHAHDLRIGWPADLLAEIGLDENTYIVVLSHDEKLDNPALAVASGPSRRLHRRPRLPLHPRQTGGRPHRARRHPCPDRPHPRPHRPQPGRPPPRRNRCRHHGGDRGGAE